LDVARIVGEIIGLVSIEQYGLVGVVSGERLLVSGLREGATNVYLYDRGRLVRLNREPVSGVARPPRGSGRIVVFRDVARGREQHLIYTIDPDEPGVERPLPGMEPARLLGVAYDDEVVVYAAATMEGVALYAHRGGGGTPEKVADLPGIGFVADYRDGLAAGIIARPDEPGRFRLFTARIGEGSLRIHEPPEEGSVTQLAIAPDGGVVYALETPRGARLYRAEHGGASGRLELPSPGLEEYGPYSFNYLGYTSRGELVAVARREGRSRVFIDGRPVEAPEGIHGAVTDWGGGLAATYTSLRVPPRVVRLPGGEPLVAGEVPGYVADALGGVGFHWVESFDGSRVPTFTLESRRAPRPGPAVVLVHGGPFAEDADMWNVFAASLALLGFHVVMPNYRGSTGYGEEWRLRIVGDPCGGELEDITSAALWARSSGLASQLYIMGYSYGGYMTLCSLTRKPGLYRAGVAGAAVADWGMMYELSDAAFRSFIDIMFAGRRELWRERSPITYIDNLREPLCIIHPQNDSRTPLKPILRFMELASEKGKTFEAHIAPDMGHAVNTIDDAIKLILPAALFLARQKEAQTTQG